MVAGLSNMGFGQNKRLRQNQLIAEWKLHGKSFQGPTFEETITRSNEVTNATTYTALPWGRIANGYRIFWVIGPTTTTTATSATTT